jgi:hypothetical protein
MNVKNLNIYSDKFTLGVVDLTHIELATDEDKTFGIDKWARLFKTGTWEELKAMGAQNAVFDKVGETMFRYSCDKDVLEQCRKVEDNQRFMAYQKNKIEALEASNAEKDNQLTQKDNQLVEKDNQLAQKDAEILALKAKLAELKQ